MTYKYNVMFSKIRKGEVFHFDAEVKLFWLYVLFMAYMLYGTGMFFDDFPTLVSERNNEGILESIISGNNLYLERPLFKYLYVIYYSLMDVNQSSLIDLLKVFQIVISFYMVTKFFSMFLDAVSSMMVSFLFIFFPTHEATTYCYLEINQTLAISLYLYAYYLAESANRLVTAGIISTLASFVTYGSTPIAFSLFVLCSLKKSYKNGLILLIPNIIYCVYYVSMTEIMNEGVKRLPEVFHLSSFFNQFLLQIGSFIDAIIGPSFFLKVWYSILENSTISIILGILFIAGYIMILKSKKEEKSQQDKVNNKLFTTLIVLTLSSLVMFAITGYYPQMAFNLGNRVTIYGSLLAAYLIVTVPIPKNVRRGILLISLFAIVGLSEHWKQWNQHQMYVIENIGNNNELVLFNGKAPIYVSGNQHSKMGPYSHIEFLTDNSVVRSIFKLAGHEKLSAGVLNKRLVYEKGAIIDKKYNNKYPVGDTVMVYDSEADQLLSIPAQDLEGYINKLSDDNRHWVQLIKNEHLNGLIQKLMPRLKYAF